MSNILVKDIFVKKNRIICTICFSKFRYSSTFIKDDLLKRIPSLKSHKCKNNLGENFVDVLENTSLAHVLEHIIIDAQTKMAINTVFEGVAILGTSEWINEEQGLAKIDVSYYDDIIALKCIKNSVIVLNDILNEWKSKD